MAHKHSIYDTDPHFKIDPATRAIQNESGKVKLMQYAAGIPITVVYVLETPIETPLSDAELLAFKALRSNKPTTTILNDSGMFMSVDYVADTKTYIDNKIAEIIKNS